MSALAEPATAESVRDVVRRIGLDVAAVHATEVDREARFPRETYDALREARLLGALIPVEAGGLGHSIVEAATAVRELARHCASSAMVLAMHHSQVACLVRHGRNDTLRALVRRIADEQLLVASATTEIGIGGNTRNSGCAVERDGDEFTLHKTAPVVSYGEQSDLVLITARRDPDSAPGDQVLVAVAQDRLTLSRISAWDTLGFRGTCSPGFEVTASGPVDLVLDDAFADISSQTMLPVSHLLWSSAWLGLAEEAADRSRRFVQTAARRSLGSTPPGAQRLAELTVTVQRFRESVQGLLARYAAICDDDATSSIDFMVAINTLKVSSSELVVDVVGQAMLICGIAGYRQDSDYSLGRLLRDAHGAAVMVNNDRILGNTAQLLLAARGD